MEDIKAIISKKYEILKSIDGGFATVYIVRHKEFGYYRAIKSLQVSSNGQITPQAQQDFKEECTKLMQLGNGNNPNIVKIYDCEIEKEPYYVEMDYVEGELLHDYSAKNFLSMKEVYKFIMDIGGALAYCHNFKDDQGIKKSVIHNDLHSGNIIRRKEDGEYILLDFGLSMENGEIIRSSKTKTGWCEFMPPERCEMECDSSKKYEAIPQWDVYCLGCLIYMALTGQAPFPKKEGNRNYTDIEVITYHLRVDELKPWEKIRDKRRAHFDALFPNQEYKDDCPDWLIDMIENCMTRKKVEDRYAYADAQEFMEQFESVIYEKAVPYKKYARALAQYKNLEEEKATLQEAYNQLEIKKAVQYPLQRNWIIAIVIAIAFACNCIPYMGDANRGNVSIGIVWKIISVLASLVVIGVVIYDTYSLKSDD